MNNRSNACLVAVGAVALLACGGPPPPPDATDLRDVACVFCDGPVADRPTVDRVVAEDSATLDADLDAASSDGASDAAIDVIIPDVPPGTCAPVGDGVKIANEARMLTRPVLVSASAGRAAASR